MLMVVLHKEDFDVLHFELKALIADDKALCMNSYEIYMGFWNKDYRSLVTLIPRGLAV